MEKDFNLDSADLELHFQTYLSLAGLNQEGVPDALVREIKMAYFTSASTMFFLITEGINRLSSENALLRLDALENQLREFLQKSIDERKTKLNKQ